MTINRVRMSFERKRQVYFFCLETFYVGKNYIFIEILSYFCGEKKYRKLMYYNNPIFPSSDFSQRWKNELTNPTYRGFANHPIKALLMIEMHTRGLYHKSLISSLFFSDFFNNWHCKSMLTFATILLPNHILFKRLPHIQCQDLQ